MGATNSSQEKQQSSSRTPMLMRLSNIYSIGESEAASKELKKKKCSKFATLRKKLIRVRRHSRSLDYGKSMRDMLSNWSLRDISALVQEYEAAVALKELSIAANLARPPASSLRQDLSNLFYYKYCTDVDLIFKGACFPTHRALLCCRSPFFCELLSHYTEYACQVPVKLKTPGVDLTLFSAVLRYLYTDELTTDDVRIDSEEILVKLAEEFGIPNPLEQDLHNLMESGMYADAVLVFTNDSDYLDSALSSDDVGPSDIPRKTYKHELLCHKAILAARSPFFRNLVLRRARSGEECTERTLHTPSRIVLDDCVISRRYARVLLNSIYQDTVELSHILKGSSSMCSLSEVQAMVAGKGLMTLVDEAMELYQIGQFLDFSLLSQGSEDIIAESINQENLLQILNWSSEPHGSSWVRLQVLHYVREEFQQISTSPILFELNKDCLIEALSSDFLQAGESEILSSVLKWGEHQLIKRIEEREPNLLSHTTHSITKKGVKKRDLKDDELKEILRDILPLVRIDHVIPQNSDVLNSILKRGLFSVLPSHMIGDDLIPTNENVWIRSKHNGLFIRPRLFLPFYEEAKSILEEHLQQSHEQDKVRGRLIQMSSVPDTLYMVEERSIYTPSNQPATVPVIPTSTATVDIIAGTIPVPDRTSLTLMLHREQELHKSKAAQRANNLPCADKRAIALQIQLRVIREFGLPDTTVEILQNSQYYYHDEKRYVDRMYRGSPLLYKHSPISTLTMGSYSPVENTSNNSDSVLSEIMPDIAMATTSSGQNQILEEFELDIGDGSSHHGTLFV